jgi:hypothetical protein
MSVCSRSLVLNKSELLESILKLVLLGIVSILELALLLLQEHVFLIVLLSMGIVIA